MSTFDGKVVEFPDIRIDYFRPDPKSRPPLAYFLSHVHSDHLVGLELCKSPFIYCTPATRDILLRLEKYPHRMNFARGILETRTQTYRHLKNLLKAIPLEIPTTIELAPGREIQVTLFDANHCVGACMFLIEGDGKVVLYTGDIRSEVWWVNGLTRHPILIPYVCPSQGAPMKRLDCMYVDTTFVVTGKDDALRDFPSKAQGIDELLRKVAQYPSGTQFYFDSWTFGYEDVWVALSKLLGSQVHVDDYRYGVYQSLMNGIELKAPEAQRLIGFQCGNHYQQGCLTTEWTRLHSCEKGTGCKIWTKDFVRITPIVSRYQGEEIAELGAGGGKSDLSQRYELQLWTSEEVGKLMGFCAAKLEGQPQLLTGVLQLLASVISDGFNPVTLNDFASTAQPQMTQPNDCGFLDLDEMPLEKLVPALAKLVTSGTPKQSQANGTDGRASIKSAMRADGLPKQITFPYSRHSSYNELCLLLEAFKPKDVFPCTVDDKNWSLECSMSTLFGHIYKSPPAFRHDDFMSQKRGSKDRPLTGDSRPGSNSNTSTEYATPDEHYSRTHSEIRHTNGGKKRSSEERSGSESDARKRMRSSREAKGDVRPTTLVDHISTPADRSRRQGIRAKAERSSDEPIILESSPGVAELARTAATHPISYRGQFLLGRSTASENGASKDARQRRSLEYGRLSPLYDRPSTNSKAEGLIHGSIFEKPHPPQSQTMEYGRLSPPPTRKERVIDNYETPYHPPEPQCPFSRLLGGSASAKTKTQPSPQASKKLAFREEAYNAVLGIDGQHWDNVGLVSVSGHQTKEEEL